MMNPVGIPTRIMPENAISQGFTRMAKSLFKLPGVLDDRFLKLLEEKPGKSHSAVRKLFNNIFVKPVRKLSVDLASFDHNEFDTKLRISAGSPAAMLIELFPVLIGARVWRAYQRGKKQHDFREIGDTLRRDISCLTAFVFFLSPVRTKLISWIQHLSGIQLIYRDRGRPNALSYTQLQERYRIENPKILAHLCREENHKGLLTAAKKTLDSTAFPAKVREKIKEFTQILGNELLPAVKRNDAGAVKQFSEKAYGILDHLESLRTESFKLLDGLHSQQAAKAKEAIPSFKDFFADYAKGKRLPADAFAFALTCIAIGLFPVWFNGWFNRKEYMEHQKTPTSGGAPQKITQTKPSPFSLADFKWPVNTTVQQPTTENTPLFGKTINQGTCK